MLDKGFHKQNLRDVVVCGGKKYSCLLTRRVSNISLQEGNITLIHMTLLCAGIRGQLYRLVGLILQSLYTNLT